jgi:hypothetical protein
LPILGFLLTGFAYTLGTILWLDARQPPWLDTRDPAGFCGDGCDLRGVRAWPERLAPVRFARRLVGGLNMVEILAALQSTLALSNLAILVAGTLIGVIIGIIPGLGTVMAVALLIPFTFGMAPEMGISLLVAVFVGGVSGGCVTAILLRMPGTPSSVATVLDGYPLAQARPGRGSHRQRHRRVLHRDHHQHPGPDRLCAGARPSSRCASISRNSSRCRCLR